MHTHIYTHTYVRPKQTLQHPKPVPGNSNNLWNSRNHVATESHMGVSEN